MSSTEYTIRGLSNQIHKTAIIDPTCILSGWDFVGKNSILGAKVKLANYVEINSDCVIGEGTNIQSMTVLNSGTKIGRNCLLSDHVATADELYPTPYTELIRRTPCKIGNNVNIGAGVTLVCCDIGDNSVIGAGSTVIGTVPPNKVYAGSPAREISTREEYDKKQEKYLK